MNAEWVSDAEGRWYVAEGDVACDGCGQSLHWRAKLDAALVELNPPDQREAFVTAEAERVGEQARRYVETEKDVCPNHGAKE